MWSCLSVTDGGKGLKQKLSSGGLVCIWKYEWQWRIKGERRVWYQSFENNKDIPILITKWEITGHLYNYLDSKLELNPSVLGSHKNTIMVCFSAEVDSSSLTLSQFTSNEWPNLTWPQMFDGGEFKCESGLCSLTVEQCCSQGHLNRDQVKRIEPQSGQGEDQTSTSPTLYDTLTQQCGTCKP